MPSFSARKFGPTDHASHTGHQVDCCEHRIRSREAVILAEGAVPEVMDAINRCESTVPAGYRPPSSIERIFIANIQFM